MVSEITTVYDLKLHASSSIHLTIDLKKQKNIIQANHFFQNCTLCHY